MVDESRSLRDLEEHGFTAWFPGNIREFDGNPLNTETPLGTPQIIGVGNAFAERDKLEEEIDEIRSLSREFLEETGQAFCYVGIRDYALVCQELESTKAVLRALVIESGGEAIPNSSLTAAREQALAVLAKAEGRSSEGHSS